MEMTASLEGEKFQSGGLEMFLQKKLENRWISVKNRILGCSV
jgi:hypothetical protein